MSGPNGETETMGWTAHATVLPNVRTPDELGRLRPDRPMIAGTVTAVRCEAQTGWRRLDYAGFEPAWCRQWRGLRSFLAADGSRHFYCSAPGHEADVRARVRRNVG